VNQPAGYNPIKWDCTQNGCWNTACRPPLEYFAACFPRKIGMTDLDATVELNGHFLFMEWKTNGGELTTGQRIYFQRLTAISDRLTVVLVRAGQSPVDVDSILVVHKGNIGEWQNCSFQDLYDRVCKWADRVNIKLVRAA